MSPIGYATEMPHPEIVYPLLSLVLGAIVGSFLNVCIWRLPREESLVLPGSRCTACQAPVAWHDNVPILSYLWLRGKCRSCKGKISLQYPVVEALTALLFFYMHRRTFTDPGMYDTGLLVPQLLLVSGLIVATFVDLAHRIIPDEITKTGMIAGPFLSALYPPMQPKLAVAQVWEPRRAAHGTVEAIAASLIGMVVGAGMIWGLGWLGAKVFKKEAMGFGDVKLMGMVGAFLGWQAVFWAFWIAPVLGLVYGVVQKLRTGDSYMPYGPFLSAASFAVMLWQAEIVQAVTQDYPTLLQGWIS